MQVSHLQVSQLGEFKLIELLAQRAAQEPSGVLPPLIGIGDDAAAWRPSPGLVALATSDMLMEGVHFRRQTATWREIGWKAMAVNLSDIAAMGGLPRYALISVGLPADFLVEDALDLYAGAAEAAGRYGAVIVGGDTIASPVGVVINVAVFGEGEADRLLRRSSARVGDVIAVTGYLGSSAAGLRMLQENLTLDAPTAALLRQAHLHPLPRVAEAQALTAAGVRCGMDLSDGLAGDLAHIGVASGVTGLIYPDRLPIHPLVRAAFPADAVALALSGGEDYELLITCPAQVLRQVGAALGHTPLTVVGQIAPPCPGQPVLVADAQGRLCPPRRQGYDHFADKLGGERLVVRHVA